MLARPEPHAIDALLTPHPTPSPQVKVEIYDDVDELVDDDFKSEAVQGAGEQTVLNEQGKPMPLPPKDH